MKRAFANLFNQLENKITDDLLRLAAASRPWHAALL